MVKNGDEWLLSGLEGILFSDQLVRRVLWCTDDWSPWLIWLTSADPKDCETDAWLDFKYRKCSLTSNVRLGIPSGNLTGCYWTCPVYSWFTSNMVVFHGKLLVYQRVVAQITHLLQSRDVEPRSSPHDSGAPCGRLLVAAWSWLLVPTLAAWPSGGDRQSANPKNQW